MLLRTFHSILLLLVLLLSHPSAKAQKAFKNQVAISAGPLLPAGRFAGSHWIGGGLGVSSATNWLSFFKPNSVRFAWSGNISYFAGKKVTVAGYPYRYPGFTALNAMAGVMYSPLHKTSVIFTGGPALTMYNGLTRFAISSKLEFHYYHSKKWAIGPGIGILKEPGAGPQWFVSLQAILPL